LIINKVIIQNVNESCNLLYIYFAFFQASIVHQSFSYASFSYVLSIFQKYSTTPFFRNAFIFKSLLTCININVFRCSTDIRLIYGKLKKLLFDASNVCRTSENKIIFLEHVEVEANLEYSRRGALQMYLTAPSGIVFLTFQLFIFKVFSTCFDW